MTHGYSAYSKGCRCDTCRAAKAEYMRDRRANGRKLREAIAARGRWLGARPDSRVVIPGITHGTLAGYQEHGCRCMPCTVRKCDTERRQLQQRKAAA